MISRQRFRPLQTLHKATESVIAPANNLAVCMCRLLPEMDKAGLMLLVPPSDLAEPTLYLEK